MDNKKMTPYTTLLKEASAELTEKKSVFIGHAAPIASEEEAIEFIRSKKKMFSDARHNVYAYSLREGNIVRYSDDNEPQGTAGIPVLNIIQKSGINDAVIVVTRYFGGILLGTGGLARAYSSAAKMAVEAAKVVTYIPHLQFVCSCSYSEYQKLKTEFDKYDVIEDSAEFGENVSLTLSATEDVYERFSKRLSEITSGKTIPLISGQNFRCVE